MAKYPEPVATPPSITTPITTTMWDLSGIRHLAVDYWVMHQECFKLGALTNLRDLESFAIILVDREPQSSESPASHLLRRPVALLPHLASVSRRLRPLLLGKLA